MSQGALAVECRYADQKVIRLLEKLNDKDTVLSVIAERAFMRRLVSHSSEIKSLCLMK